MPQFCLCYDCGHCWTSKKSKEEYQCSDCKSRDVDTAPSLTSFKQLVEENTRPGPAPKDSSTDPIIEDSAGGCDVVDSTPTYPKSTTPAPDSEVEDVTLTKDEVPVYTAFWLHRRDHYTKAQNIQWLMGRFRLQRYKAKEILEKFVNPVKIPEGDFPTPS